MARILSSVLVVGLLAGTAAAFAVTERLKVARSPILDTRIEHKLFSPVCGCPTEQTTVSFELRESDRVTLAMIDADGQVVRTLLDEEPVDAGRLAVAWDGRADGGAVVPEGEYRPRVHLDDERRTIVLPNPIRVDVTAPAVASFRVEPQAFSPGGDGRNDRMRVFYRFGEAAHPLVFVDGERRVRGRFRRAEGSVDWYGILDGEPLPAGTYGISVAAQDAAGNISARTAPVAVRIRYVELARDHVTIPAGLRFGIRIRSDAESIRWRFAGGTGTAEPGLLVLRAPRAPGEYTLFVEAGGRGARARVTVVPRDR